MITAVTRGTADTPAALRAAWFRDASRRANGGWWALSGFSIQMTIALERFVRAFLSDARPPQHIEVEGLSDFLLGDRDALHLVQVKRSLTAATLGSALAEAYEIVGFCSPALAARLTFQLVCEICEPGLTLATPSAAQIFGTKPHDPDQLALTLSRFDPYAPIRVTSHPRLALRRTLLNGGVRDADRVATDALGKLFDAFDGRDRNGVSNALTQIMSGILNAAEPHEVTGGRLLTPDRFAAKPLTSDRLFSGYRPNLQSLVGQRFRPRDDLLAPIQKAAETWLAGLAGHYTVEDQRLPVFWLDGRPGGGKSVLTLQLLESLVLQGRLSAVSELVDADELSKWLTSCPKWFEPNEPQAEIGFLDDLPRVLTTDAVDHLIDDVFYRDTPYAGLITCAPTEDCDRFRNASQRLDITVCRVPPPSEAEFEAFRLWAENRRGARLHRRATEGQSLASFVVALEAPEARAEPASRSTATPSLALRMAAAVNALGFAVAPQVLDQIDLDAFANLRGGLELALERDEGGVRLAHDEVIWDLYVEWLGMTGIPFAEAWGVDLAHAVAERLKAGDGRAARTIIGGLMDRRLMRAKLHQIGESDLDRALNAAYAALRGRCSIAEQAPLFRQWLGAKLGGRLADGADLRTEAEVLLNNGAVDAGDRADIAIGLLAGNQTDGPAAAAVRHVVSTEPVPTVVAYMVQLFGHGPTGRRRALGMQWLRAHATRAAVAPVLARGITADAPSDLKSLGVQFVRRFLTAPCSGPVLWALRLHHRTPEFYRLQDTWLQTAADPETALQIYSAQLNSSHRERYASRALAWASQNLTLRGAHELLARLVRCRPDSVEVNTLVDRWLKDHPFTAESTRLHAELVKTFPRDALTIQGAVRHLAAGAPGTGYLSSVLVEELTKLRNGELRRIRTALSGHEITLFDRMTTGRAYSPPSRPRRRAVAGR